MMQPTFGSLTSDIARLLRKSFDQRGRQIGLSLAQSRVLIFLSRQEGINQAGLADLLEVQPISLARLLDRMEGAGWIERRADPCDRRAHRLYLSEKAKPLLHELLQMSADTQAEALAGLSESETVVLTSLLARVHANLSDRVAPMTEDADDECSR